VKNVYHIELDSVGGATTYTYNIVAASLEMAIMKAKELFVRDFAGHPYACGKSVVANPRSATRGIRINE
jgi:1,2-phenylacetyl-CoA epoxidase PaaB subunit